MITELKDMNKFLIPGSLTHSCLLLSGWFIQPCLLNPPSVINCEHLRTSRFQMFTPSINKDGPQEQEYQ